MTNYFKNWGNYLMDVLMLTFILGLFLTTGLVFALIGGDVDKAVTNFVKEMSKD